METWTSIPLHLGTRPADEDHVVWLKTSEQNIQKPWGEIVKSAAVYKDKNYLKNHFCLVWSKVVFTK